MEKLEINLAIAEAVGWKRGRMIEPGWFVWRNESGSLRGQSVIPDYYDSLDSCHDFEKILLKDTNSLWFPYCRALHIATTGMGEHANAPQRCEAFLKTTGGWIEPSTVGKP